MPKILVSDSIAREGIEILQRNAQVVVDDQITTDALIAAIPDYHALIVRSRAKVIAPIIKAGTRLRVKVMACAKSIDMMGRRQPRCRYADAQRGWAATHILKHDFAQAVRQRKKESAMFSIRVIMRTVSIHSKERK